MSKLFNFSDFYNFPGVFPGSSHLCLQTLNAPGQRFCSLAHFSYCKGWCSLYIKKGITTIQSCPSNAASGLDLFPRYADMYSYVSCKIGYHTFHEKVVLNKIHFAVFL